MMYPYPRFHFRVDIGGMIQAGFTECTGLGSTTDVVEYREGQEASNPRKLARNTHYSNIVLKRGITDALELQEWRQAVLDGQTVKFDGVIELLNELQEPVARWIFRRGWPCRLSGPDLNSTENDVAIEELEICHEGLKRDSIDADLQQGSTDADLQ